MQATRQQIMDVLRERGATSVRDLGVHLGLTPTGVRQHLAILEREGFVETREVRGRVGRPALSYRLTAEGEALYPKAYQQLTLAVIETLARRLGDAELRALMADVAESMAQPRRDEVAHGATGDRVAAACNLLRSESIVADWERRDDGDGYLIHGRTCPYQAVACAHPVICEMDCAHLGALTGLHVELLSSQARGDEVCTFHLTSRTARTVGL